MKEKREVYSFLESKGFKLSDHDTSKYFGDYYDTFSNNDLELRFSSSKSSQGIDIQNVRDKGNWYLLVSVKSLLYNETNLNVITTIDEYIDFLTKELDRINNLFSIPNYEATKKRLNEIDEERVKQMFPGLRKN